MIIEKRELELNGHKLTFRSAAPEDAVTFMVKALKPRA